MERDSNLNLKYLTSGNPIETQSHVNTFFPKSWKKFAPQSLNLIRFNGKSPTSYSSDSASFTDSSLSCQPLNIGTSRNTCYSPKNLNNIDISQSHFVLNLILSTLLFSPISSIPRLQLRPFKQIILPLESSNQILSNPWAREMLSLVVYMNSRV